jgi:hypothetical protein
MSMVEVERGIETRRASEKYEKADEVPALYSHFPIARFIRSPRLLWSRGVTGQSLSRMSGLDGRKSFQFGLAHLHLLASFETNTSSSPLDKADTVAVQALVDRSDTRSRPGHWNTLALALDVASELSFVTLTEIFDNGRLHRKLDQVEWQEPDNVPHPNDADPAARDTTDLSEAPVSVSSNDGRDELSDTEGTKEGIGWHFHEEKSMGTSDEDERLGDDGHLEVDDHVDIGVVDVLGSTISSIETNAKLVFEEVGLHNNDQQGNRGHGKIQAIGHSVREDFRQVP